MVWERREADEKGDKSFLIYEQKEDNQDHHAEKGKKLKNISRPGAGLVIKEKGSGFNKGGQVVRQLRRFKFQAEPLEVGLKLGCHWAFLEKGVNFKPEAGVPSPLIQAEGLIGQGANEKKERDKDENHNQDAG